MNGEERQGLGAVLYVAMIDSGNDVEAQLLSATDDMDHHAAYSHPCVRPNGDGVGIFSDGNQRRPPPINEPRSADPLYRFVLCGSPLHNRLGLYWHQSFSRGRR
jgi:hypothetical protein